MPSTMRHIQRVIAASVFAALCTTLSGCGNTSATNFDPMEMLDFLDQKKPLQGVRKPVFPDGVPGVEQGVPKELYKGAQAQTDVPPVMAAPPAPEPKSKRGKRSAPAQASPEASSEEAGSAAPAAPKPAKRKRTSPTAIPREDAAPADDQQAAPATQQPPQQQMSPFPAPMPSGSFQR